MVILGILILVCALFLIISVLLQSSKNHRMSGVVSGGAETFFGKQKGKTIDAKLSKATAIISAIFAILVLALYIVNARTNQNKVGGTAAGQISTDNFQVEDKAEVAEDEANTEGETAAEGETAEGENAEA